MKIKRLGGSNLKRWIKSGWAAYFLWLFFGICLLFSSLFPISAPIYGWLVVINWLVGVYYILGKALLSSGSSYETREPFHNPNRPGGKNKRVFKNTVRKTNYFNVAPRAGAWIKRNFIKFSNYQK